MTINTSIRRLATIFMLLFVGMSGYLVYWQVVVAQQVADNSLNRRYCQLDQAPVRGRIFDRNGELLAYSRADPRAVCGYTRVYTEPSLAGLIGFYAGPDFLSTGIERTFDSLLSGREGMTSYDQIRNSLLHRPPVGYDLYLTVDLRIQRIVNERFDDAYYIDEKDTFAADRGATVVMEPQTGEVLAMVSRPGYDPNKLIQTLQRNDHSYYEQLESDPDHSLLFRPLDGLYVPGSIYKAVTLMAGLDSGKTTLTQPWSREQALGPVYFNNHAIGPVGNNIEDYTYSYPINTEYAFAHSDNVVFAQIGVNTSLQTWLDYNERFYIGKQIPFDLPVKVSTVAPRDGREMLDVDLAANAFGQGTDYVTPLQMALFNNAIAADGRLMRPYVIKRVSDQDGNIYENILPQTLSTPMKLETAQQVRQAMYGVIQCGPGILEHVNMNISPWNIIGKTGTAQVSDTGELPAHSWLITQAPYDVNNVSQLPALTVVAMRENAGEAGMTVGPMIAALYDDIFSKKYVEVQQPPAPEVNYCGRTGLLQ